MSRFSMEEYADILFVYGFCDGNSREAVREYRRRFPHRRAPSRGVFEYTYRRLRQGDLRDHRERGTGVESVAVEESILRLLGNDPSISIRRIAFRLGISTASVWRLINRNSLHPYHFTSVQEIMPEDKRRRLEFCYWIMEQDIEDRHFLKRILFTDESQFRRDGVVNFHNLHIWAAENPHSRIQTSFQRRFNLNVWAGIIGNSLIGPYFLPQTLNGDIYLEFIENILNDLLEDVPLHNRRRMFYQHDGAPAHSTRAVSDLLREKFGDRVIGRMGPIFWPPRSPDLTPLDFYLWGFMKERVYQSEVSSREELVNRIEEVTATVRRQLSRKNLTREFRRRAMACIQSNGGHFEHLLR